MRPWRGDGSRGGAGRAWAALLAVFLWLAGAACSSSSGGGGVRDGGGDGGPTQDAVLPPPDGTPGDGAPSPDGGLDVKVPPDAGADAQPPPDAARDGGPDAGAPTTCDDPQDCPSGVCLWGPEGGYCPPPCDPGCPAGWVCAEVQTAIDVLVVCVYPHAALCRPCADHADCDVGPGIARCADLGAEGRFCATACAGGADCPDGYECRDVDPVAVGAQLGCLPADGTCECSPYAIAEGARTACAVANEYGSCRGTRGCETGGLSACDAPVPAAETCDGRDEDCDGETDEAPPGGGPLAPCEPGQVCAGGACVAGCLHDCAAGETGCLDGDTPWACGEADDGDDCRERLPQADCGAGASCVDGACVAGCLHDCAAGERGCLDGDTPWVCGEAGDGDDCLERLPQADCGAGEVCVGGACETGCLSECGPGERGCLDADTPWVCGEAGDGDDCRERLPQAACGAGEACVAGVCQAACVDECVAGEVGCFDENRPWLCGDAADGDACLDRVPQNLCGVGHSCQAGACVVGCVDACAAGETGCEGTGVAWICGEAGDGDDCRDRIRTTCAREEACDVVLGCVVVCQDACAGPGARGCDAGGVPWACGEAGDGDGCWEQLPRDPCGADEACREGACVSAVFRLGRALVGLGSCGVSGASGAFRAHVGLGFVSPAGVLAPAAGGGHSVELGVLGAARGE
jgi:hypothetical protein